MRNELSSCIKKLLFFIFYSGLLFPASKAQIADYDKEISLLYTHEIQLKFQQFFQKIRNNVRNAPDTVNVKLHFIRKSDGTGQTKDIADVVSDLNVTNLQLANSEIYIQLCPDVNYINSDQLWAYDDDTELWLLTESYCQQGALNIFVVDSISRLGTSVGGLGYHIGGSLEGVVMVYGLVGNNSTMVHEIGHVFHLLHTHGKSLHPTNQCPTGYWNDPYISLEYWCRGAVHDTGDVNFDGVPDCNQTGDDICDTPAEPNLIGDSLTSGCTYVGNLTDVNGDIYQPVIGNFMSYGPCRDHFTAEQFAKMKFALYHFGLHLFTKDCGNIPDTLIVTNSNDFEKGSLRWALECAIHRTSHTYIGFNIPQNNPVIKPESCFQLLEKPMTIDGLSQPLGIISIDGSEISTTNGWCFRIESDSIDIAGFSIKNINGTAIYDYNGKNHLSIKQISIDSTNGSALYFKKTKDLLIENCELKNSASSGIYLDMAENTHIYNNDVYDNLNTGIYVKKSKNIYLGNSGKGNRMYNNAAHGAYFNDSCQSVNILDNTFGKDPVTGDYSGNDYYGLYVKLSKNFQIGSAAHPNTFCSNNSYGLRLHKSDSIVVENSLILNNSTSGIQADSCRAVSLGTASSGNIIAGNSYHGIHLFNHCSEINVLNNIIGLTADTTSVLANGYFGIAIDNCRNITIGEPANGNIIAGSLFYGIEVDQGSDSVVIRSNAIGTDFGGIRSLPNNSTGIKINASTNVIIGGDDAASANIIAFNPYSLRVQDSSAFWFVMQNQFYCSVNGMYVDSSSEIIKRPVILSAEFPGIINGKTIPNVDVWFYVSDSTCSRCEGRHFLGMQHFSDSVWMYVSQDTLKAGDKITILAVNSEGSSVFSECKTVNTTTQIGQLQSVTEDIFSIYPNPFDERIVVTTGRNAECEISIYSLKGEILVSKKTNGIRAEIETKSLASGLYVVRVSTGNKTEWRVFQKK